MYVRSRIAFGHSPRQAEVNNQLNRRIWPPVTILISHVPDAIKPHRKRLKKTVLTPVSTLQAESCTCNHENKHNTETGRMQTGLCGSQWKYPGHKTHGTKKFYFWKQVSQIYDASIASTFWSPWTESGCNGIQMSNIHSARAVYPQDKACTRTGNRHTLARNSSSSGSHRISSNTKLQRKFQMPTKLTAARLYRFSLLFNLLKPTGYVMHQQI